MTRNEGIGLGLAAIGHVLLFAILSLVWAAKPAPLPTPKPIEVSLVDDIALDQHAPAAPEPPSQSAAPEQGPPDDAPPPAKAEEVAPDPTPPKPQPEAAPPPKPAPAKPDPPKPVAAKPDKPDKAKPAPAKPAAPATKAVAAAKTAGTNPKATKAKPSGSLLDDNFRKGLTQAPSKAKPSEAAPGAVMDAKAAADIQSAIQRQVQPCANRQVIPGPGAARIVVTVRLNLNRDGSLSSQPEISAPPSGVDDDNERYVDAVKRAAIATYTGCSPLRGLPQELYDIPRGWKRFSLRYHLPTS